MLGGFRIEVEKRHEAQCLYSSGVMLTFAWSVCNLDALTRNTAMLTQPLTHSLTVRFLRSYKPWGLLTEAER